MMAAIKKAEHAGDYCLRLTFHDGVSGIVDLKSWIVGRGGVFQPLEDLAYFKSVSIHPDFETICWPNGADFSADVLYDLVIQTEADVATIARSMNQIDAGQGMDVQDFFADLRQKLLEMKAAQQNET
jgi:hypothetical protein